MRDKNKKQGWDVAKRKCPGVKRGQSEREKETVRLFFCSSLV